MTGRPVVCLDLDRTTIYSAAALQLEGAGDPAPAVHCVETSDGSPGAPALSFMTAPAAATLTRLTTVAHVVPVTTRTRAQLARVRLPGPAPRFAVAANGGHLLVDGSPDADWAALVRTRLADVAPLAEVADHIGPPAHFRRSVRDADGLFVYAVVDRGALPAAWLEDLAAWCAPRGWRVSLQGRKVYAVPGPLTKSAAAAEVRARCGGAALFAAGDSLLDADLLEYADTAIRPAHGELADTGWTRPHVAVTRGRGGTAGEQVLAAAYRWATSAPAPQPSLVTRTTTGA